MWDDLYVHRFTTIPTWIKVAALGLLALITVGAWALLFDAHRTPPAPTHSPSPRVSESPSPSQSQDEEQEEEANTLYEPHVVAFIGDGYSTGSTLSDASQRWTTLLSDEFGWDEQNFALDGSGYISALFADGNYAGQVSEVIDAAPDVVIISGGRNDLVHSTGAVSEAAASLFSSLREGLPESVILVVNPWWDSSAPPAGLTAMADSISQIASDAGVVYLDTGAPLTDPSQFAGETINPNEEGHVALALAVQTALTDQWPDIQSDGADEEEAE